MTFFVKLKWAAQDRKLFRAVRSCTGSWSTKHAAVKDLRDRLLDLQNYRCVYCQAPIEADENGYREIEHILPKSSTKGCTLASGSNNNVKKRRSTLGYPQFVYEPRNLALCCKQCNTAKGSYDPLRDRGCIRPLLKYPKASDIAWYHPHYQLYTDHIDLDENFIFSAVSPEGERVISECGLSDPKVLEKKFLVRARVRTKQTKSLEHAVGYLVASVDALTFSAEHAVQALAEHFKITPAEARAIFTLFRTAKSAVDCEKARNACIAMDRRLQRRNASSGTVAAALRRI